ncbi:MAG TPA: methyltransferase domain-containing protein [Acidobacteriaceae bacterium]|nr:methyltransferase domain-containing protein [Acidobacteriaceae bacterium]
MTEWNASEYDRLSALQDTMAAEVLSLLQLKGSERILDLGCGNGKTTASIAERVPDGSVTGVDASADMIAFAKEHWTAGHPNLQFTVAEARHLPFKREFDLVVSFNALHWISDQALPLQGIRQALRSEGKAQLRLVAKGERTCIEDVIDDTRKSPRWASYFKGFRDPFLHITPDEYAALAEQQGFRVLSTRTSDKAWDFGSRDAFLARMKVTMIEWMQHLPEADRVLFITDALDRYQHVAATAPGEENYFRFYQMDIVLAPQ